MMLKGFAVTNFRGFKDRMELDLGAVRNYGFNTGCIRDNLINTALVVGTNACGKTNLGLAIFDIVATLTDKGTIMEQKDQGAFLNGDSAEPHATFEYEFQSDIGTIRYVYSKTAPDSIVYERLDVGRDNIFLRDGDDSDWTGLKEIGAGNLRMDVPDGHLAILRYIANNTVQSEDSPVALVMDFAEHMLYFRSLQENAYIGIVKGVESLEEYIIRNGMIADFQRFLKDMADVDVELGSVRVEGIGDLFVQRTKNRPIVFNSVSSSGTKSLMLFYYWMRHFKDVRFLFMDEFDAFYHYELADKILRRMVELDDVQVILTSHNTTLLKNSSLRPDCCLYMDSGRIASFADRTDRDIRQGHNLEKMYRGGEFDVRSQGAVHRRRETGRAPHAYLHAQGTDGDQTREHLRARRIHTPAAQEDVPRWIDRRGPRCRVRPTRGCVRR